MVEECINIESLMVVDEVKSKIKDFSEFLVKNNERNKLLKIEGGLFYNLCISGNRGCGKSTIIDTIVDLIYDKEIVPEEGFFNITLKDLFINHPLIRSAGEYKGGVIVVDCSIDNRRGYEEHIATLEKVVNRHRKNFIFILQGNKKDIQTIKNCSGIRNNIHFNIDIEDFSDEETLNIIKSMGEKEGYKIAQEANEVILEQINYIKEENLFENIYTAEQILGKAIVNKKLFGKENILTKDDFEFAKVNKKEKLDKMKEDKSINPMDELEGLIGLDEVKIKVREIINYAILQRKRRELGINEDKICLHMCFTGAPGTGKTTVARLVGEVLKDLNLLSKGHLVEVSREGLCGKYVGHTAAITKAKIDEAKGGILFIDEAYSLVSNSKVDYGKEALNTLVKYMEEYRDDLVVILAGYNDEMEELLDMNVGLRSRIGFKIEFKNYSSEELSNIWIKFYHDNNYLLSKSAIKEIKNICNEINNMLPDEDGNGRTIRKLYERSKLIQATRVINEGLTELEDIITINNQDILKLYNEFKYKEEKNKNRNIGFHFERL